MGRAFRRPCRTLPHRPRTRRVATAQRRQGPRRHESEGEVMARRISSVLALAQASFRADWPGNGWRYELRAGKQFYRSVAATTIAELNRPGFDGVGRPTKVRRARKA